MHVVRLFFGTQRRAAITLSILAAVILFGLFFPEVLGDALNRLATALMPAVNNVLTLVIMIGAIILNHSQGDNPEVAKEEGEVAPLKPRRKSLALVRSRLFHIRLMRVTHTEDRFLLRDNVIIYATRR